MAKRFLSALLTLCVAFSLLPSAALAYDPEAGLRTAITNVAGNGTVTLGDTIGLIDTLTITGDKSFTIDLNGCTLSCNAPVIDYQGTGTLTITDSSSAGGGKIAAATSTAIQSNGGGKILVSGKATISGGMFAFSIGGGSAAAGKAVLEIAGGTVCSTNPANFTIQNRSDGNVIVSGGTVTGVGGIDSIYNGGDVVVSSGTITTSDYAINAGGDVTLTGGTVESAGSSHEAIYTGASINIPSGTVVVKGGSQIMNKAPDLTGYTNYQWRTSSGGTFTPSTTVSYAWAAADTYLGIKPFDPPTTYTLTYTAAPNGTIMGVSPQTVNSGANGTAVTAIPNSGYHFVSWSDGVATATRTDTNVTHNMAFAASFASNASAPDHTGGSTTTVYNDPSKANANIWISGKGLGGNDLLLTQSLTGGSDYNVLLMLADQNDILGMYEISLQSGKSSTGSGMYLTFDLANSYAGQAFTLVHKKADGTLEYLYATAGADGNVKFGPVYELSPFMLMNGRMLYTPDYALIDVPKTGGSPSSLAFVLITLAVAFGIRTAAYRKRRV